MGLCYGLWLRLFPLLPRTGLCGRGACPPHLPAWHWSSDPLGSASSTPTSDPPNGYYPALAWSDICAAHCKKRACVHNLIVSLLAHLPVCLPACIM
eukprot:2111427-Alexandrium_andersonii.AAC.1